VLLEKESATPVNGEEFVAGVIRDLETSGLSEKEKALLRFVDRVNHDSPTITAETMQPLYAVGWDDAAIYYAITVCALFNFTIAGWMPRACTRFRTRRTGRVESGRQARVM